jgi:hypothetical protein
MEKGLRPMAHAHWREDDALMVDQGNHFSFDIVSVLSYFSCLRSCPLSYRL